MLSLGAYRHRHRPSSRWGHGETCCVLVGGGIALGMLGVWASYTRRLPLQDCDARCAKTKLPPRQDLPHPTWSSQVVLHPNLVNPTHTLRLGRGLRASPRQPSSARRSLLLCCPSGSFQLRLGYQHEYYQIAITWKRSGTRWGTGGATPNFLTQGLYLR